MSPAAADLPPGGDVGDVPDTAGDDVRDDRIEDERSTLGARLAAYRESAGYTQRSLAPRLGYSRSSVANAETGRQNLTRDFWERADEILLASGDLTARWDRIQRLVRQRRIAHARAARAERAARVAAWRSARVPRLVDPPGGDPLSASPQPVRNPDQAPRHLPSAIQNWYRPVPDPRAAADEERDCPLPAPREPAPGPTATTRPEPEHEHEYLHERGRFGAPRLAGWPPGTGPPPPASPQTGPRGNVAGPYDTRATPRDHGTHRPATGATSPPTSVPPNGTNNAYRPIVGGRSHLDAFGRQPVAEAGEGTDAMRRRSFVLRFGGATALGFASPSLGLETVRHGLTRSMAEDRAEAHADDWEQIAADHARGYLLAPPRAFLDALAVDLVQIQRATDAGGRGQQVADLRRSAAVLACLTALTAGNLGRQQEAVRWWRTARRLADDARDPLTVTWVRGEEVVRSGYERRPHQVTLALADEAEARAGGTAASGVLSVLAGRAQTLAAAGRGGEADVALTRLREAFAAAPASVTDDRDSLFGWPERSLRFTESVVHSYVGRFEEARAAQDRALALCPPGHPRGRAQIELHRALCLVRAGDVAGATGHALPVLHGLPDGHLVLPIAELGRQILASVPARERHQPGVADLRGALTAAGMRAAAGC